MSIQHPLNVNERDLLLRSGDEEHMMIEVRSTHTVEKGVMHLLSAGPVEAKKKTQLEPTSAVFEKIQYVFFSLANDGLWGKILMPPNLPHTLLLEHRWAT
ncbi:hypothetical protein CERZMDRAFT_94178 [Cercospora zeae-maydis SCOH1-5]|uniref:Uncharacterized protein n=1 Tax=Cercospora zeae-maydis SCOH1-5 TaxID=717836 RepID=A0A6A6FQR2_9PEZI|nr:hypothetical protein CERZMDRAFT_94178 [Cercospora zeae-maydis SCOH1-5]